MRASAQAGGVSVVHYLSAPLLGDEAIPHAEDRDFLDADRLPCRCHVEERLAMGSGAYSRHGHLRRDQRLAPPVLLNEYGAADLDVLGG